MSMRATAGIQSFFQRQRIPVTMGLIAGIVVFSVVLFLTHFPPLTTSLIIHGSSFEHPWAFFTYPFISDLGDGYGVIGLVFECYWLSWVGGALENEIGSLKFGLTWLVSSIVSALCVVIGAIAIGRPEEAFAIGALLPISVLTVIWGVKNKTASIMMMAILPITGFFLALLTIAIVLVDYGRTNVALGVFACIPLGIAWVYAEGKIPGFAYRRKEASIAYKPSKEARAREQQFFEDVRKREQERDERERLRKLFEGSIRDED